MRHGDHVAPLIRRSNCMKRRRLFNILAAVSMVMCVASAGLWIRSYTHRDELQFRVLHKYGRLETGTGFVAFSLYGFWTSGRFDVSYEPREIQPDDAEIYVPLARFGEIFGVLLPFWLLMLCLATPPVAWAVRRYGMNRKKV